MGRMPRNPICPIRPAGRTRIELRRRSNSKYFWKILIRRNDDDDALKAAAFLMSQRKQVMEIDQIQEADLLERMSEEDVSVFQVSIADLTKLTKLDFGNLTDADSHEATSVGPRRIESYEDIRI